MAETRRGFLKMTASGLALGLPPRTGAQPPRPGTAGRDGELRRRESGEAVLTFGGDWFLTRKLSASVTPETDAVFDVFRSADAGFANLENGLSTVGSAELGGFKQGPALRSHPDLVSELAWGGVRTVSLANNHTGNFGRRALLQTIATLDAANIAHAGAGANIDRAFAPALVTAGGLRIAFFSVYSLYYNFGADDQATATEPGLAVCRAYDVIVQPQVGYDTAKFGEAPYLIEPKTPASHTIIAALGADVDRLKTAIRQAAPQSDLTILSVHAHWGRHTKHDLPPNQRAFAQEMVDAGVDLFLGHGPHAIRGVEVYRGKPIVHSVGNLVLRPPAGLAAPLPADDPGHEGLVVRATVARRTIRALEVLPLAIDGRGDPRFAAGEQAGRTLAKLTGLSAPFGTEIARKAWFGSVTV